VVATNTQLTDGFDFLEFIYIARKPCLQTLPPELLEEIFGYFSSRLTSFDCQPAKFGRRDLSALSQVCSSVRGVVERVLYRDIRVNTDGWIYVDCHIRSSRGLGCLRCLLRTFKERPRLRHYVRSVFLDWNRHFVEPPSMEHLRSSRMWFSGNGEQEYVDQVQRAFLLLVKSCTSLQSIFVTEFPHEISKEISLKSPNLSSFGIKYSSDTIQTVLEKFKGLRELYIHDTYFDSSLFRQVPHHRLKRLHVHCVPSTPTDILHQAIEICADSIEELHITRAVSLNIKLPLSVTTYLTSFASPSILATSLGFSVI
jgi:hypothetical protein